jgi:anti-sigma regulatory factor (Ser/Thr protein kinase)
MVAEEGLSFENGMVVCVSFWLAVGFQDQAIFPDVLPEWSRALLDNGMTAGGIVALLLMSLVRLRRGRMPHIDLPARIGAIDQAQQFVAEVARSCGWDRDAILRLELVTEEAMLFLLESGAEETDRGRRLRLSAKAEHGQQVHLELLSGAAGENFERALTRVDLEAPPREDEVGLRVLARLAERVRHQQFHGVDVLLVTVGSKPL